MSTDPVRYDAFADWYIEFSEGWVPYLLLPADHVGPSGPADSADPDSLAGQRVLDLACAWGTTSRHLAERGARVTGLDLSGGMLARARQLEAEEPFGLTYLQGDATTTGWWDGRPFDGVVSNMALMDIDDLAGAVRTMATVLRPGGWWTFSVVHPCFPGHTDRATGREALSSWPPDGGYGREGWWNTRGDGVRGRVGANHRMLSTYLNTVLAAGLIVEEVAEEDDEVPRILMVRGRRG